MGIFRDIYRNYISKSLLWILGGLIMVSGSQSGAKVLPKPVGKPVRISPPPGGPDAVLQNLPTVMNNWFQPAFYPFPGFTPIPVPYLSQITGQFNTYFIDGFLLNPLNDQIVFADFIQNRWSDGTQTYAPFLGTKTNGHSKNGGLTWSYGPPAEQVIPLGGTISQIVDPAFKYSKTGILYALTKFSDIVTNPPNQNPIGGLFFQRSKNNGKSWSKPKIVTEVPVNFFFFDGGAGGPFGTGLGIEGFGLLPDPADAKLVHLTYPNVVCPSTFYGNMFYFRTKNGGKTFSKPKQIYSMVNDPVWLKEHFDPDFISDPNYFIFGGQTFTALAQFVKVNKDVLLIPVFRQYPKIGSTTYTQTAADSVIDKAALRSTDNGKTWSPIAGATPQYTLPFVHDPANGIGNTGVFIFVGQENQSNVYSPYTGRVYMAFMANNPDINPDPEINFFYPRIVISVSNDQGVTWSELVKVNLTPTNISIEGQQAFQPNIALTKDGSLVVGYYDFRNWRGQVGEDIATTPLPTDAWLAVYKEVPDPKGGSTGIGLDVVGEIRVTPQSFNSRIGIYSINFEAVLNPIGLVVNDRNQLLVTYEMTNQGGIFGPTVTGYKGVNLDLNNRNNIFLQRYQFPRPSNQ